MSLASMAFRWCIGAGVAAVSVTALFAGLQYAGAATAPPPSAGSAAVTVPAAYTSPTVVNNSDGTLSLYAVRGDGNLWEEHQSVPFGTFSGWRQLTAIGGFTGMPAVVQAAGGVTDIFAVQGAECQVWQTSLAAPGAQPAPLTQIGTPPTPCPETDPAAVVQSSGAISLFSTDLNGTILEDSQAAPGGAFGNWQPIATITQGYTGNRLAVVQLPSGIIAIYVRAGGAALSGPLSAPAVVWGISQSVPGGPFSAPVALGGTPDGMSGDPVAIRTAGGVIAVYSSTTSGELVGISQSKAFGPFGQWQQLSPQLTTYALHFYGTPAVLLTASGVIAVYARDDTTGAIWGVSQTKAFGPFSPWVQITPDSSVSYYLDPGPPFAMFTSTHVIAIYAPDSNNLIAGVSQNVPYGPFGPWQELG